MIFLVLRSPDTVCCTVVCLVPRKQDLLRLISPFPFFPLLLEQVGSNPSKPYVFEHLRQTPTKMLFHEQRRISPLVTGQVSRVCGASVDHAFFVVPCVYVAMHVSI